MKQYINIATRGSKLALIQTNMVKALLQQHFPELKVRIQIISTSGDIDQQTPLVALGKSAVFTDTLEKALLEGSADIVVHSMKDMAFPGPEALSIAAVLKREDPRDVLIHRDHKKLNELDASDIIATCSIRRKLQLSTSIPPTVTNIRGNVDNRIQQMNDGAATGLILAAAGLHRLQLHHLISDYIDTDTMMPSPCQGIIAIQSRKADENTKTLLQKINHAQTFAIAQIEKQFVMLTGGICEMNYSCIATPIQQNQFELKASVIEQNGKKYSITVTGIAMGLAEKALYQLNNIQYKKREPIYAVA